MKYQSMGPHASMSSRKSSHVPAIRGWRRSKVAPAKDAQCNSAVKQGEHHRSSITSATGGQRGSSINHGQCEKRKWSGKSVTHGQRHSSITSSIVRVKGGSTKPSVQGNITTRDYSNYAIIINSSIFVMRMRYSPLSNTHPGKRQIIKCPPNTNIRSSNYSHLFWKMDASNNNTTRVMNEHSEVTEVLISLSSP